MEDPKVINAALAGAITGVMVMSLTYVVVPGSLGFYVGLAFGMAIYFLVRRVGKNK